jgi:hypothetical protein
MRVREISTGVTGEVTEVGAASASVYFGHANKVRFEREVWITDLEPLEEPVYFGDGPLKDKVYNPEAFNA